ncbi:hypothetical protein HA466_0044810 [Hirschfeldia incana]|nr:hypothetical protein HA466_0044810 [Hirschfeldia incana]
MMLLALDAFILGAILCLVYLLWKLFYETKGDSAGFGPKRSGPGPKRRKHVLPAVLLLTILSATLLASKCVGPALSVVTQAFSGPHLVDGKPRAEEPLIDKEESLIIQDTASVPDDDRLKIGECFEGKNIDEAPEKQPCEQLKFTYYAADDFDIVGNTPNTPSDSY